MTNDYPINKIYNKLKKLFISYLYVETTRKPYECNTCSNDESTRFNEGVSIIINSNLIDIYINKNMVPHKHTQKR
jgi:hypothetical protein